MSPNNKKLSKEDLDFLYNEIYIKKSYKDLKLTISDFIIDYIKNVIKDDPSDYNIISIKSLLSYYHKKKKKVGTKKILKEKNLVYELETSMDKIDKKEFNKLYNKYSNLIKEFSKIHTLIDDIINKITPFKSNKKLNIIQKPKTKKHNSCVINLSDVHVGKNIESSEIGGVSSFNNEIVKNRLESYLNTILEKIQEHKSEKIYINMIGDIIDNDSIYKGQVNFISDQVVDQILYAIELLEEFILKIKENTKLPIELHCVYGNHGRRGRKGEFKYYNNFDYLIYKILERRFKLVENIKFEIPITWFDRYNIYGNKILIMHGDDIRSWMNIPYYGIERASVKFSQALQEFYDIIILGHFHTASSITLQGRDIILNGSFDGGDIFSLKHLFTMNQPNQWMFFINKDSGQIDARYKVIFE